MLGRARALIERLTVTILLWLPTLMIAWYAAGALLRRLGRFWNARGW
jgi:hypothetical protein